MLMLSSTTTSNANFADFPAFTSTFDHVIVFVSLLYPVVFSSFILVPVGISSVTVTVPSAFPLFVRVIVYINVSPTFAFDLSTDFTPVIFATLVSGFSGISLLSIFATFFTVSVVLSLTTTSNVNVAVSPFAFTSTFDHVIVFISLLYPVVFSSFILVPVGISSVTVTVPSAFPLFVRVIVYINVSPTFAFDLSTDFTPVIFATLVSGFSGISLLSIFATFFTVSVVSSLTTTSNVNVAVPPFAFTSTFDHVIVFVALLYPVVFSSFILVPVGISSVTVTVPSAFPLFVNVIVYVNVSPTFASALSTSFLPVIFIIPVSVSFVVFPLIIAEFFIVPFSALTLTVNSTFSVSPGSTVTLQVNFFVFSSSLLSLFSNTVPSGTLSYIIAFATLSPLFFTLIVYVSVSPIFTLSLSTVLCISRFDFFAVKFAVDAIDANCVGPQPTSNDSQGFLTVSSLSVTYS